jgi:repressor LexA
MSAGHHITSKKDLTVKQQKVLEFIRERIRENMPPTIREIAKFMGFSSTGTVRDYLNALERKGHLKKTKRFARSIQLLRGGLNRIPIIATIPAGNPDLAYEDNIGYLNPADLLGRREAEGQIFALKVVGESMREVGIMEGDIAIIHKQTTAANGDIIAALLENNEVTLKRLRQKNNKAYLEPANKDYQPIYKNFSVIGKVITILRKY